MLKHRNLVRRSASSIAISLALVGCGSGGDEPQAAANGAGDAAAVADGDTPKEIVGPDGTKRTVLKPEQAVVLADQLHKRGEAAKATQVLSAAIKANPKTITAWVKRGQIYAENRLFRRAISDLTRAIELQPENAVLLNTRGYYNLQQQNYREALADFDSAVKVDSTNAIALNNRGLVRVAVSQYDAAIADFDAAVQHKPDYVDALNNRGFAKMQVEQFDAAIADFTKAVEHNEKYVNAWNNRGLAYARSERHKEAVADFSKAIELSPMVAKHYHHRSEAYAASGDSAAAEKDLDQVNWLRRLASLNQQIARDNTAIAGYLSRSKHLASAGMLKEAEADVERAMKLDPASIEAMTAKANVLMLSGKMDEARTLCEQAIAKSPRNETYSLRGDIKMAQGDYDGAIADYNSAKRLDSGVAQAYLLRSAQAKEAGNIQQASADVEFAKSIDPTITQ